MEEGQRCLHACVRDTRSSTLIFLYTYTQLCCQVIFLPSPLSLSLSTSFVSLGSVFVIAKIVVAVLA